MNSCQQIRSLLPLSVGGELGPEQSKLVGEHTARCPSCQSEVAQYVALASVAKSAHGREYGLPDRVRRTIAAEASAKATRGFWPLPVVLLPGRAAWMASAAAVLVLAVFAATFWSRSGSVMDSRQRISKLDVVADRGVVRLAWSDGEKVTYTVYKTADPRIAGRGESHVVKGHVWVDTDPDSSPVVFYRIE